VTVARPLRIGLFSGNYNYLREGANQALNRLVGYLERQGHQVRIHSPVTDTPAFEPQGTLVPVPSIALPIRSEFRLALGLPAPIRREVEHFAPDLIHVSTPDILGTRAETFAEHLGVPIVASLHTRFETYLEHYGLGWLRPLAEAHLKRFYRRAACVLAPTPGLIEEMKRLRGDDHVALWSRGVDRDLFNPMRRDVQWRAAQGWTEDTIVALFLGRLVIEKGIDLFRETVQLLRERGYDVRALVVGEGPARERLVGVQGAVLTGHLQDEDLARAVASADLMINPSMTEAFGNVVLEAMASGLAVVSADAPSARALIDDGGTGVLCRSQTAAAYADAAARLIEAPAKRRAIGEAARAASAAYSWDAASAAVEAAYRETLSRVAAQRPS
jgi:glycosyltransferase involved in cell wall biosynthesis